MREFQAGVGNVTKQGGKWKGTMRYREEGEPGWHRLTKVFDIRSYPGNNRGREKALSEWRKWREELVADEPARAAREEAERKAEESGGVLLVPDMTVAAFVDYYLSEWLPGQKYIEPSTMTAYRRREKVVTHGTARKGEMGRCRGLGEVGLCDLTTAAIVQWRNDIAGRYAPSTVRDCLSLLSAALKTAADEDHQLIVRNPADAVKPPKQKADEPNHIERDERRRLLADLDATLAGAKGHEHESKAAALGVKLSLLTGMRQGEVCGLRWRDVDFDEGFVRVRAAIGRSGNGCYEKETKSGSGRRNISFAGCFVGDFRPLADDLAARRADMEEQAALAGVGLSRDAFVIGTVDGAYMNPRHLFRAWQRRVERLGLVDNRGNAPCFHALRHTFGTVMAHCHVPVATLKAIMGHASIDTTFKYYVGVMDDANRQAMMQATAAMTEGIAYLIPFADLAERQGEEPNGTEG